MSRRPFSQDRLEHLLLRPRTFWRHDVDYSLTSATQMARLERQLEVRSTYYLMTDSPFYSPAEALTFAAVANGLGHQVGWHVDARRTPPESIGRIAADADVSFHCPRPTELWTRFGGFRSAYDPIWEGSYFADSRGRFAFGDPEDHPSHLHIQINLHPEWWFDPCWIERTEDETYAAFFHEPKPVPA